MSDRQKSYYKGVRMVEHDLLKQGAVAMGVVLLLAIFLSAIFSSPDDPTVTAQRVAQVEPRLLLVTAAQDLAGQGDLSTYGPPYNNGTDSLQTLGPIALQKWAGVTIPIDPAKDFVLTPLLKIAPLDSTLSAALKAYGKGGSSERTAWNQAVLQALPKATLSGGHLVLTGSQYGPVPVLLDTYLQLAKTGILEAVINVSGSVYQTDFTKALLLLQGDAMGQAATPLHMLGSQWGMMKEPGFYPGASWLWLYTLLYQIPPWSTSDQADLLVALTVGLFSIVLLLTPFIPGVRDIPRWIPIYRLIWREKRRKA